MLGVGLNNHNDSNNLVVHFSLSLSFMRRNEEEEKKQSNYFSFEGWRVFLSL